MASNKVFSVLLLFCMSGALALFKEDAGDKIEIDYYNTVRRGITKYDYTKLEVEASLLEMVDMPDSIDRENVRLEFKSSETDWEVFNEKPTMKGGVYKWTISSLVPCHDHNVRLTVFGVDSEEPHMFQYPSTILAASSEQIIKSRYRPDTPQDVRVEVQGSVHNVFWTASHCVDTYDLSYKLMGDSQYKTMPVVKKNFAQISEPLDICQEYEVLLSAVLGEEFSLDQSVTFTTLPDLEVSDRLEPEVEAGTEWATVRWEGSEKLSCIPSYSVQLCHDDSGDCQERIEMERDDSVKFMEFSPAQPLAMCSAYSLHITPLHEKTTVKPKVVQLRTQSQPLEAVGAALGPVTAELAGDQTLEVRWGSVPCAEEYHVYHRQSKDEDWAWLATTRGTSYTTSSKACTTTSYAVSAFIDGVESEKVQFEETIFSGVNKAELPVIEVVEKANGSMTFILKTGEVNTLCEVDRLHIKYAGGEEFFEMTNLESDRITISLREEADKVEGRLHYAASEENDWSPWASSDAPTMEKQTLREMNFLLPIIIGSVVALALIITVIFLVVKSKKGQAKYDSEKANGDTDESKKLNDSSEEKIIKGKK